MQNFKKFMSSLMALSLVLTLGISVASAADNSGISTSTADLSAGVLTVVSVSPLNYSTTLKGADETLNSDFNVNVIDPTGSYAGWQLTAQITGPLSSVDTNTPLPATSHKMIATSAVPTYGIVPSEANPTVSATSKLAFPTEAPVTFYTAKPDSGVGTSTIHVDTELLVPVETKAAHNYTATLTITIAPVVQGQQG